MTDEEGTAMEGALRPRLTREFLETLVEAAKIHGYSGDWVEVERFVQSTFAIAGEEPPEMTPY